MKKIIATILTIIMVAMLLNVTIFATEETVETPDEVVDSNEIVDASDEITEDTSEVETPEETTPVIDISDFDRDEFADMFVAYLFSGTENADELMDKIIAMGEQYQKYKEDGYTFKERIEQMITTENLVVLASAGFLVICGVAFFVIEEKRKKDRQITKHYVAKLVEKYSKEVENNKKVKEALLKQTETVEEMRRILGELMADADENKLNLDVATRSSVAVAKMVKDVFLCSKTIDASGKELLTRNYLEAVEEHNDSKD